MAHSRLREIVATPLGIAMPGGSVPEVVRDGVSGYMCRTTREMVNRLRSLNISPALVRNYVEENFAIERMARDYMALYRDVLDVDGPRNVA